MIPKTIKKVTVFLLMGASIVLFADLPNEDAQETKLSEPFQATTQGYETAIFKIFGTLGALVAFIFVTVWILKRLSHGRLAAFNSSRSIKILEKRPLSPKSILYLIEVKGKKFIISESQCEVRYLSTLTDS
jgi:flagellar biogenesis protein FliO